MKIEFVSYTGKYPNLCRGILTLLVDGKEMKFGHGYCDFNYETGNFNDTNYDSFWESSGECGFCGGGYTDSYVTNGEWIVYEEELPDFLQPYAKYIEEILNENMEKGCCGGCL